MAGKNIVGGGVKRGYLRHLVEGVGSHHRGHGTSAHARFHPIHCLIGTDLDVVLRGVCLENLRGDIVVIFDGVDVGVDIPTVSIEEGLQRSQVIRLRIANIVCKSPQFGDANFAVAWLLTASGFDLRRQGAGHVHPALLNGQRVCAQGFFFCLGDVGIRTVGQSQNRGDTNDSDGPRERGHQGTALLRHQVVKGERKRGQEAHRSTTYRLGLANFFGAGDERTRIGNNFTVRKLDNAGCVLVCEFRVVGHHDDQTVLSDISQEVHDLDTGLGVKSTGWFVSQEDFRIVNQRSSNGDTLHLTARKLRGLLPDVLGQPDAFQGLQRALAAFASGDTREGQRQLNVGQDGLVRDQVVGLENEANAVVAVGVPIAGLVVLR